MSPDPAFERGFAAPVAGVDESGRGPLAGPVVAAAVILDLGAAPPGIVDSKRLARPAREALFAALQGCARIGVGTADVAEIDRLNILEATLLAMRRAVDALGAPPAHALIDGNRAPELSCAATPLVGGDDRCLSIAAASIVAKVTRDRLMDALARDCPGYGWERNAGYGTAEHLAALSRLGVTRHHRCSFAPVAALLSRPAD